MNWLAHLFLSEPSPEFRIGNLLPDLLRPADCQKLPVKFAAGIACHREIDRFTDGHPVVRRSLGRLDSRHRRYGGIIVDMFYDHLLAANWQHYSRVPLDEFTREVYASFQAYRLEVPPEAFAVLERLSAEDWLGSYRNLDGVRTALDRIGGRLRKAFPLGESVETLVSLREEFHADFQEFFPRLMEFTGGRQGTGRS